MSTTSTFNRTAPAAPPPRRAGLFGRLAGFSQRHRWTALLLWLVVLVGAGAGASAAGDHYRDDNALPGTESQQAVDLLKAHGSPQAGDTVIIVLHRAAGLRAAGTADSVHTMLRKVAALPGVASVGDPYQDRTALSADKTIGFTTVVLDKPAGTTTSDKARQLLDTARTAQHDGLQVELGGAAARSLVKDSGGAAEGSGLLAALVILVFMFGTVIAATLPVISAVFAVGTTLSGIILATHVVTIPSYSPYVMMLVGLGVGIDYALLIFARFRGELVDGADPHTATRRALEAAGRTVLFAGTTVIIALLGLITLGLGSLRGLAVAVALTVLVTMVASLTLLPALLHLFGKRFARQFTARARRRAEKGKAAYGARWRQWGAAVQRHPVAALLVPVVALGVLAVPALGMRLGLADAGSDPAGSTSRAAYGLLSQGFGPGFNGPLIVVADGHGKAVGAPAAELSRTLRQTPGIAGATDPIPVRDGKVASVIAFPTSAPQDKHTTGLVHRLRDDVLPKLAGGTGAGYRVGGPTAAVVDYSDMVTARMPLFVSIVVGLSVLVLMAVFRSVLIPLKAALLNLLSIGASLGAMTLVFQDGRLGAQAGPLEAFLPILVFAIVFGLSMDYEIFLVSRMREEWLRTGDPDRAVREGLAHTGGVITAAGAVMIVVFGSFVLSSQRMLQQFGFGLAVAILVDALVIRCLIVPAAMRLMGRHSWWLPGTVARRLPELRVEKS
ncbi:MMPL family transporter [Streptomyces morookaense]|uniref:MMPL family transporter n=1 Tax=Streptomyces morookaense TaxID=1970 RepID=A0A7Y7B1X5_STRMO|nr:MMPL family transporter [Streptomyces morookaense]NVK77533.1 MMPL family transporter [Streptomyces morookaense]GHF22326.1 membrane protein [Streptomyces morookaense]